MMLSLAVLSTALLFGGMTLYSSTSAAAALLWWPRDAVYAAVMAAVAVTTVPVRQILMPAINRATDAGLRQRFKWLHGLSVVITLGHIAATGWLLSKLA